MHDVFFIFYDKSLAEPVRCIRVTLDYGLRLTDIESYMYSIFTESSSPAQPYSSSDPISSSPDWLSPTSCLLRFELDRILTGDLCSLISSGPDSISSRPS